MISNEPIWTDSDGDELRLQVTIENIYLGTNDAEVRIPKEGVVALLRRIAERADVEVLILEKPQAKRTPRKLSVSSNPTFSVQVSLDAGFSYTERIPVAESAHLIWDIATAAAFIADSVDANVVRKVVTDLLGAGGTIVNADDVAKHLIRVGYRKHEAPARKKGIHVFNNMPEISTP